MFRQRDDIVCQQAVELVSDYLAGALRPAQLRGFERHLAACDGCAEYLAQMRATITLTGQLGASDLAPEIRDEFIALYRRWRAEQSGPADPGRPAS